MRTEEEIRERLELAKMQIRIYSPWSVARYEKDRFSFILNTAIVDILNWVLESEEQ